MTTDTSEKGLERLICAALTGAPCDPTAGKALWLSVQPLTAWAGYAATPRTTTESFA